MVERPTGETIFYAYHPGKARAGFTQVFPATANDVKVLISPTGTVTGRIVDLEWQAPSQPTGRRTVDQRQVSPLRFQRVRGGNRRTGPIHVQGWPGGFGRRIRGLPQERSDSLWPAYGPRTANGRAIRDP